MGTDHYFLDSMNAIIGLALGVLAFVAVVFGCLVLQLVVVKQYKKRFAIIII